jgi:hypothetical protein
MHGEAQLGQPRGRVEHRLTLVDATHTPRINAARSSPYAVLLPEHWALLRVALSDTGLGHPADGWFRPKRWLRPRGAPLERILA